MDRRLRAGRGHGWLTALAAGADPADLAAALREVLAVADGLVRPFAEALHADGARRVVVVPHRFLHLVPFWAVRH